MNMPELPELEVLVGRVSANLQEIQDLLFRDGKIQEPRRLGIRFPRGYIRRLYEFEERLLFVTDPVLRKNIAYAFQYTDLLRWMSNWFDIGLSILSIHNKTGILFFASIAEAMLVGFILFAKNQKNLFDCSEAVPFSEMIDCLMRESVLPREFADELHWLRRQRNNIHLRKVLLQEQSIEYEKYSFKEYNRARNVVQDLNSILLNEYKKQVGEWRSD